MSVRGVRDSKVKVFSNFITFFVVNLKDLQRSSNSTNAADLGSDFVNVFVDAKSVCSAQS